MPLGESPITQWVMMGKVGIFPGESWRNLFPQELLGLKIFSPSNLPQWYSNKAAASWPQKSESELGLEGFGIWRRDRDSKIGIGIRKSGSLFRDFGIIIGTPSRDFGIESPYLLILNEKYIDIPAAQSGFWFGGGGSLQKFTLSL